MQIIHSACFVENGKLNYIFSLQTADLDGLDYPPLGDGTELIVHNGSVIDSATGGSGIPSLTNTNFYTIYPAE